MIIHRLRQNSWTKSRRKVLRSFLLAIRSHLYSITLRYLFLQTHATSYSFSVELLHVHCKEENHIPFPIYSLRNPYINLKFENSLDCVQKPQLNRTFMNSASVYGLGSGHTSQGRIDQVDILQGDVLYKE